jgi:methylated-DNA-[protein]-cysteine S-methyltransferase
VPKVTNDGITATSLSGPRGETHVAASACGIVAIDVLAPRDEFAAELERRFGRPPRFVAAAGATGQLRAGVEALRRFLDGDEAAFDGVPLDLDDRPAWDRAVLEAVRAVPWGATSSYGRIATAIGRRGAARAVGGAVGRNPISLAIPCHRIIAGDGTLGGYGGGWWGSRELRLELKRELLAREGTIIGTRAPEADARQIADTDVVAQATLGTHRPR